VFWVHIEALAEPPAMGNRATRSSQVPTDSWNDLRFRQFSIDFHFGITYQRAMFPEIMVQINFDALPCAEKTFSRASFSELAMFRKSCHTAHAALVAKIAI
jgi:hypothetical protein